MRPSPTEEHTAEAILRRRLADLGREYDIALQRAAEAQEQLGLALDELRRLRAARQHVRNELERTRAVGRPGSNSAAGFQGGGLREGKTRETIDSPKCQISTRLALPHSQRQPVVSEGER